MVGDDAIRSEQLRRLTEVSRALTYATSLETVLRLAVDRAVELFSADKAVLMLEDGSGLLHIRASHGVDDEVVQRFREPLDEGLIQRLQGLFGDVQTECFVGVPLVARGEVTGLLAVVRLNGQACTDADEWLLSALADQAAVALENARLASDARREMQDRLDELQGASETKERALSTMAHELRTPLNAIESYAQLLEMSMLGPINDRQLEALGRIRMSGRHLLAVLEDVLDMARLNAGVSMVRPTRMLVSTVMEEAAQLVLPAAMAKDQSLTVEPAAELWVRADPARLRQVIANLLGNAVKYTPLRGTIALRARTEDRADGSWCAVEIVDSGPGIATGEIDRIFEPYYRAPGTDTEAGAGLGLAIASELVRQMGGAISVTAADGGGTTFTVRIPLWTEARR
jgi:phosphoserine phosphatase RsbU/P